MANQDNTERNRAIRFAAKTMTDKSVEYRMKGGTIAILIAVAAFADLITLIPIAGDFVGPVYWICVSILLYMKGFGIFNARRFITSAVSTVAEIIPVVQELPMLLVGTIVLIIFSRIEDKTGMNIMPGKKKGAGDAASGAIEAANMYRDGQREPGQEYDEEGEYRNSNLKPLNNDGVRQPEARA